MKNCTSEKPVGTVILCAFDKLHNQVLELTLSVEDYYGESHPVIDDDNYRVQRSIRLIHGQIFDYDGKLDQDFNNEYDSKGSYVRSKVVHADGTVIED